MSTNIQNTGESSILASQWESTSPFGARQQVRVQINSHGDVMAHAVSETAFQRLVNTLVEKCSFGRYKSVWIQKTDLPELHFTATVEYDEYKKKCQEGTGLELHEFIFRRLDIPSFHRSSIEVCKTMVQTEIDMIKNKKPLWQTSEEIKHLAEELRIATQNRTG